jgi:hypothetical protein
MEIINHYLERVTYFRKHRLDMLTIYNSTNDEQERSVITDILSDIDTKLNHYTELLEALNVG